MDPNVSWITVNGSCRMRTRLRRLARNPMIAAFWDFHARRGRCSIWVNTMPAETRLFFCLKDNFGVLVHDPQNGATAAIDAPEADAVEAALQATGWTLTDILVT